MNRMKSVSLSIVGLLILSGAFLSCGKADHYLYIAKNQKMKNMFCDCPAGFSPTDDFLKCSRESKVDPLKPGDPSPILVGDDGPYYHASLNLADADGNQNWPFDVQGDEFDGVHPYVFDSTHQPLPFGGVLTTDPAYLFWRLRATGPDRVTIKGEQAEQWYSKTFCVDLPSPKNYLIHIGADNNYQVKIDGKAFANCVDSAYCFTSGILYNQSFSTGKHLVELKFVNHDESSPGAVWFEIFDNTFQDAKNARHDGDMKVVYSSKTLVGDFWDHSGEVCPDGYAYDVCDKDKKCTKLEYQDCR